MVKIPVIVQNRHVHLSQAHRETLFRGGGVTPLSALGHRGQHACRETVAVIGKNGRLDHVRVLGPEREATQIELSAADAFALGLNAPVRVSGDLARAASCRLAGPNGELRAVSCVIIPARHLHCNEDDARRLGLSHCQIATLAVPGREGERIEHVTVRVHPTFALEFHLTTDEASEYWLHTGDHVCLV